MSDKTFKILLSGIVALGAASTAALIAYTAYLYESCSIISFIANGI